MIFLTAFQGTFAFMTNKLRIGKVNSFDQMVLLNEGTDLVS